MGLWSKLPPGPTATSCLTCKRRHKKCDRSKPFCERCLKGGHVCLGYEQKKPNRTDRFLPSDPTRETNSSSLQLGSLNSSLSPPPRVSETGSCWNTNVDTLGNGGSKGSTDNCHHQFNSKTSAPDVAGQTIALSLGYEPQKDFSGSFSWFDDDCLIYDTFPPARSTTRMTGTRLPQSSQVNTTVFQQPHYTLDTPLTLTLTSEIPRGVSITPSDVRNIVDYVLSHYDRVRSTMYFNPQGDPIERMRRIVVWRLSTCAFARGGMLIDAKIRDSVLEERDCSYDREFARWIEGFEQAVRERLDQLTTSEELRERLIDSLEIFFAKSVILGATVTYRLFCQFAPKFLQIVNHTTPLRSAQHDSTVSIAHLLASPFYKCADYMFMDIVGSMVYGLPQVLEYNTDINLSHTRLHPVEWHNCLPGKLLVVLAKLNVFRDGGIGDWQELEQWLVRWEPRPGFKPRGLDSCKSIAWFALQEAWRHILLIYLYLVGT
ncbi:unnamed protein product [Rhizoctonia solani]|uniref:Zn(2)-C6 fungal-type domain-containing protein n=1 Tax=Rhizoctonia solani TaxID=456999 RepID=A0A8H3AIX9_9AGAM|nr:unnamed protein product [Rhizoctonia solani]